MKPAGSRCATGVDSSISPVSVAAGWSRFTISNSSGGAGSGCAAYVIGPANAWTSTVPVWPDGRRSAKSVPLPASRSSQTGVVNVSGTRGPTGNAVGAGVPNAHGSPAAYENVWPGATSSRTVLTARGNVKTALQFSRGAMSHEAS